MKNSSRKHHYLPRHYLAGFTNSQNSFFVYDKQNDRIFPTNPGGSFFENNLNTATFPNGDSSDFLEDLYTETENQFWPTLGKLRQSTHKTPIELFDKMHLFLFLLFLYWRLPTNFGFVEQLSEKAFRDNGEFDFLRLVNASGQRAPKEITEMIRNSTAFKKSFRQIVPFVPFYKDNDWAAKLEAWRFLYTGDDKSWYMVGDNPIIVRGDSSHGLVDCLGNFVFPVSGRILLIGVKKPVKQVIPPEFAIQFNTAIIETSQRFVACQSKDFLEAIISDYKLHVKFRKTSTIIPEMFDMLKAENISS